MTRRGGRAWGWTDRCENPQLAVAGASKTFGKLGETKEYQSIILVKLGVWCVNHWHVSRVNSREYVVSLKFMLFMYRFPGMLKT